MTIGDKFKLSKDALENYGKEHKDKIYTIQERYHGTDEHPGYDENGGHWIYDIEELNFSLYSWEMIKM